jgi:S-formylglutathione hydrolase
MAWRAHDAALLIESGAARGRFDDILIDQGTDDGFVGDQLKPELLEAACRAAGQPLTLRMQEGYDHSYFFISTFVGEHIAWHAQRL